MLPAIRIIPAKTKQRQQAFTHRIDIPGWNAIKVAVENAGISGLPEKNERIGMFAEPSAYPGTKRLTGFCVMIVYEGHRMCRIDTGQCVVEDTAEIFPLPVQRDTLQIKVKRHIKKTHISVHFTDVVSERIQIIAPVFPDGE